MKTIKNYKVKTLIPELKWHELNDNGIEKYCKNFLNIRNIKNIKCIKPSYEEGTVCFNYAFDNEELDDLDIAIDYLVENYYRINLSKLNIGDIITYETKRDIEHFGTIHKTDNTLKGTIIRSKWGTLGIFETDLYSIPKLYGNIVTFWKKEI